MQSMNHTRIEHDAFGMIEVPSARLWGAQTERSQKYFAISTRTYATGCHLCAGANKRNCRTG